MKKNAVIKFLESIGFKVNSEDALVEIGVEDAETPEVEVEAAAPAVQPNSAAPAIPENVVKLNKLITDLGGFDAFQGLLLAAAEMQANVQTEAEKRKAALVTALVANSAGALAEDDLKDVDVPTLELMAKTMRPVQNVDYSVLGIQQNTTKSKVEPLARPAVLLAQKSQ